MKKITYSALMLFILALAACSNPIDAGEDDGQMTNSSDTNLRTDPGDGVSTQTDSLYKDDGSGAYPKVNTVTGEIEQAKSNEMQGTQGATGTTGEASKNKPGSK